MSKLSRWLVTGISLSVLAALLALFIVASPVDAQWRLSGTPQVSIGSTDGSGGDAFGSVRGVVRLDNGNVMVGDSQTREIRLFSAAGRVLADAGGDGSGPGEFRTIASMRRCGGSIHVYDPAMMRITVYDDSAANTGILNVAEHVGDGRPPDDFHCSPSGAVAYLVRAPAPPPGIGAHRPTGRLVVRDAAGTTVTLAPVPASERYFSGREDFPRPLGKSTSVAVSRDAVYIATGGTLEDRRTVEILRYSLDGERLDGVRDTMAAVEVTPADVRRFIDAEVANAPAASVAESRRAYMGLSYPASFPSISNLLIDPSGNLWVEEYRLPHEPSATWRIYDEEGARIGRITMPENFTVTEVGDDYVAGIATDELGVEYARVYGLVK